MINPRLQSASITPSTRPAGETGEISPYPTVVSVMIEYHIASPILWIEDPSARDSASRSNTITAAYAAMIPIPILMFLFLLFIFPMFPSA